MKTQNAMVRVMVLNATFNNIPVISWRLILLVEETGLPGEYRRPVIGHWQILSHYVVSSTPCHLIRSICFTNDHGSVPFVIITIRSFPLSWLITGFVIGVTQRVSHMEQELFTLPEFTPVFNCVRGVRFCKGFMFYSCYLCLFPHSGVQHDFHIRWYSCRLAVTWRVSRLEQELLALPEDMSPPPVFNGVSFARYSVFCVIFL